MPQGFASAPACWDEAMARFFSPETEEDQGNAAKEADQLPDSFEEFFTYYQDDSWIFSDHEEIHAACEGGSHGLQDV
jgi:hypothetical protein